MLLRSFQLYFRTKPLGECWFHDKSVEAGPGCCLITPEKMSVGSNKPRAAARCGLSVHLCVASYASSIRVSVCICHMQWPPAVFLAYLFCHATHLLCIKGPQVTDLGTVFIPLSSEDAEHMLKVNWCPKS